MQDTSFIGTGPNNLKGLFVTAEGIEGAGKSTVIRYLRELLEEANVPHIVTREPGGTEIAEEIRKLLLMHREEEMAADTELLLMFASRAQHLARVILPALNKGQWVLCDRFTDATYAYQGGGRKISFERIAQLEQWVQRGLKPDKTFILDVPVSLGMKRIARRKNIDRIELEKMDFFERVRQTYLKRAKRRPDIYHIIDASRPKHIVQQHLRNIFDILIQTWKEETELRT